MIDNSLYHSNLILFSDLTGVLKLPDSGKKARCAHPRPIEFKAVFVYQQGTLVAHYPNFMDTVRVLVEALDRRHRSFTKKTNPINVVIAFWVRFVLGIPSADDRNDFILEQKSQRVDYVRTVIQHSVAVIGRDLSDSAQSARLNFFLRAPEQFKKSSLMIYQDDHF